MQQDPATSNRQRRNMEDECKDITTRLYGTIKEGVAKCSNWSTTSLKT